MDTEDKIENIRRNKAQILRDWGMDPYPSHSILDPDSKMSKDISIVKNEENFSGWSKSEEPIVLSGRIISQRGQGGIMFLNIKDDSGSIQLVFSKQDCEKFSYAFPNKKDLDFGEMQSLFDIGDFIEVRGRLFKTKTEEQSLLVERWQMLTKSLRSLPSEWYGFKDEEERFRKRYLDILMNPEVKEVFLRKSKFWQSIRNFLLEKGFLEVETPVLESVPGGAEAKPFITHHNALDMDVFLRISPELWLKRLMVAGFPKVFEIGRIFRNEGIDAEHLQDYTQMEFYWSYADYNDGMKLVEEMYKKVAEEVYNKTKFQIKGFDIDLSQKWERYDYCVIIKEMTGVDILKTDLKIMEKKLQELGIEYDKKGFNKTRAIDNLWKYCRKDIAGPGFLINVPVAMEPLAKRKSDNPELVERFQVILAGSELGKGFSELNDPDDQQGRFNEQAILRKHGDEEAQRTDDDFVEALKYGMPPTCGFGVSERLFSFFEDKSVRETTLFPLMRKKEE